MSLKAVWESDAEGVLRAVRDDETLAQAIAALTNLSEDEHPLLETKCAAAMATLCAGFPWADHCKHLQRDLLLRAFDRLRPAQEFNMPTAAKPSVYHDARMRGSSVATNISRPGISRSPSLVLGDGDLDASNRDPVVAAVLRYGIKYLAGSSDAFCQAFLTTTPLSLLQHCNPSLALEVAAIRAVYTCGLRSSCHPHALEMIHNYIHTHRVDPCRLASVQLARTLSQRLSSPPTNIGMLHAPSIPQSQANATAPIARFVSSPVSVTTSWASAQQRLPQPQQQPQHQQQQQHQQQRRTRPPRTQLSKTIDFGSPGVTRKSTTEHGEVYETMI